MELYTYHPADFNLVTQKVELGESPCYNDEYLDIRKKFQAAYDFLFKKIERKDNVWCYGAPVINSSKNNKVQSFKPERLWHLDVPEKYIVAIDSSMWDFVINGWYYLGDEAYEALFSHVADDDGEKQRQIDEAIEGIFDGNPFNSYDRLVKPLKKADIFHDQFLIPSPIKKNWIVRTYIFEAERKISDGIKK